MYEIIDENLRIASCNIEDLTLDQASCFLSKWEEGAKLGSLSLFTDPERGYVILNKDNKLFETNLEFAKAYLSASDEAVERYKNEKNGKLSEIASVLDWFRNYSRVQSELKMIDNQKFDMFENPVIEDVLKALMREKSSALFQLLSAYSYGVMNGKRKERARRKAGATA